MEQHPVPQNIIGFQFRLIGNMTLRQFGYLAGGCLLGYILFRALPGPWIFQFSVGLFFAFVGFSLAFVPIQERPLDRWVVSFIRSLFSPTQFIWKKTPQVPSFLTTTFGPPALKKETTQQFSESKRKLEAYLQSLPQAPHVHLDSFERAYLARVLSLSGQLATTPSSPTGMTPVGIPVPPREVKLPPSGKITFWGQAGKLEFAEKIKPPPPSVPKPPQPPITPPPELLAEIERLKKELTLLKKAPPSPTTPEGKAYQEKVLALERELEQAEREKDKMVTQMLTLEKRLAQKPQVPVVPKEILEETPPTVKIVPPKLSAQVGLPKLTETPNVITGVVQDKEGDLLPNILVEVKDQKGNPVRAFKTNTLGQFLSATPLLSGVYTLELEDSRGDLQFDIIEIKLTGTVLPPVLILAKTQKEVRREKLQKVLFGETT